MTNYPRQHVFGLWGEQGKHANSTQKDTAESSCREVSVLTTELSIF